MSSLNHSGKHHSPMCQLFKIYCWAFQIRQLSKRYQKNQFFYIWSSSNPQCNEDSQKSKEEYVMQLLKEFDTLFFKHILFLFFFFFGSKALKNAFDSFSVNSSIVKFFWSLVFGGCLKDGSTLYFYIVYNDFFLRCAFPFLLLQMLCILNVFTVQLCCCCNWLLSYQLWKIGWLSGCQYYKG